MKQILQHLRTGKMELVELPCPVIGRSMVLVQTRTSLISAGTERMLVEFSKANLLQKARSQPDKVKQVLDKLKTDGLMPTLEAVFNKLDEPMPLGYCNAGTVLEVGPGVIGIQPGDRVASNGPHAEVVCVPHHLCAKVPEGVSDEAAAFTVLSSIALQGMRLALPAEVRENSPIPKQVGYLFG
jgi:threonine dehydrogenase-like Zn-dependent dehydrogenase